MTTDPIALANPHDHPWAVASIHPTTGRKHVTLLPSRTVATRLARRLRGTGYVARTWRIDGTWLALEAADSEDGGTPQP